MIEDRLQETFDGSPPPGPPRPARSTGSCAPPRPPVPPVGGATALVLVAALALAWSCPPALRHDDASGGCPRRRDRPRALDGGPAGRRRPPPGVRGRGAGRLGGQPPPGRGSSCGRSPRAAPPAAGPVQLVTYVLESALPPGPERPGQDDSLRRRQLPRTVSAGPRAAVDRQLPGRSTAGSGPTSQDLPAGAPPWWHVPGRTAASAACPARTCSPCAPCKVASLRSTATAPPRSTAWPSPAAVGARPIANAVNGPGPRPRPDCADGLTSSSFGAPTTP